MTGDKAPGIYSRELADQYPGGVKKYGGVTNVGEMKANFRMNCIPELMFDGNIPAYDDFLEQRCVLMVQKIKTWFEAL